MSEEDYEILVVEGTSGTHLGRERATSYGPNVRYFCEERSPMPAALELAHVATQAPLLGFLGNTDIVTPRLIEHALQAAHLAREPIMVVPSYERALPGEYAFGGLFLAASSTPEEPLEHVDYRGDARELLETSRFSDVNSNGYLCSLTESELFICTRAKYEELRKSPQIATLRTIDDVYGHLVDSPTTRMIVLGGEGCFRQGAASTEPVQARKDLWRRADRQPLLFGVVPGQAHETLRTSISHALLHESLSREAARNEWPLDLPAVAVARTSEPAVADPRTQASTPPRLSIVVVVFRIVRQAENTLYSLSTQHQWNVSDEDYEIIVVENRSCSMLGAERALALGRNVRYFERDEPGVSPAPALNFGVAQARAPVVGLMVDGARMATPRVIEHALLACTLDDRPIIAVPGYHLGPGMQHVTSRDGYDEATEQKLLAGVEWKRSGYRLFEIGSFDEASKNGFLNPLLECTCLFTAKACFDEIGGMDQRFDSPGGGEVNHDLFDRMCRLERTRYIVLWGEGTFHQFHGGVSSQGAEERDALLDTFRRQYDALRGRRFATYEREPLLLGTFAAPAHELLMKAAELGRLRYGMTRKAGGPEWPNG